MAYVSEQNVHSALIQLSIPHQKFAMATIYAFLVLVVLSVKEGSLYGPLPF
jgi:hypothetical protein